MAKIFIRSADVAGILEYSSTAAFRVRRHELESLHGFPRPAWPERRPMTWRRADVLRWINRQGHPPRPTQET